METFVVVFIIGVFGFVIVTFAVRLVCEILAAMRLVPAPARSRNTGQRRSSFSSSSDSGGWDFGGSDSGGSSCGSGCGGGGD